MVKVLRVFSAFGAFLLMNAFVTPGAAGPVGGRGFGDDYDWYKISDGMQKAKEAGKPSMVVIHKSWCGACKRLGPIFAQSSGIKSLANKFVMINVHDDEEPQGDAKFAPDGSYIPRIIFFDYEGNMMDVNVKASNPKFGYYYPDDQGVVSSMKKAVALHSLLKPDEL
eukprot:jgi/Mesvir1/17192/Mv07611-RA.1